jgi:hypothetical protein
VPTLPPVLRCCKPSHEIARPVKPPLITYVSILSQVAPAAAYLRAATRTRAGGAVALGGLVSVFANVVGRIMAEHYHNNQVVSYLSSPITAALFLLAIREWQVSLRDRRILWVGFVGFLLIWVILVAFVENMWDFTIATGPMYSLVLLGAAGWTLLRRAFALEITPLVHTDWFWISLGIAVYGACTALSEPIGGILVARGRFDLFDIAWQVRAGCSIIGFLLISWGIYRGPMVSKFSTAP